jgi:hypothetical protein
MRQLSPQAIDNDTASRMQAGIAQYVAKSQELRQIVRKVAEDHVRPFPGIAELAGPLGGEARIYGFVGVPKLKLRPAVSRTLREWVFYPEHEKRTASAEYKKTREQLIYKEKRGCLICGVKADVVDDEAKRADPNVNPYGAKQLETHHHVIEWALGNAIDVDKFNKYVLPNLRTRHPNDALYQSDLTAPEVLGWIDNNRDNLWVLCDVHHRAKYVGIHEITLPIWGPQDIFKNEAIGRLIELHDKDVRDKKTKNSARAKPGTRKKGNSAKAKPGTKKK